MYKGMSNIKMLICDGGITKNSIDIRPIKECKYLIEKNQSVEIIALYRDDNESNISYNKIEDINCTFIGSCSKFTNFLEKYIFKNKKKYIYPFYFINFYFKIKKYLKGKKIDYLHCQNLYAAIIGILLNKKVVFDMRECYGLQSSDKNNLFSKLKIILTKYICKKSYKIIYVNKFQLGHYLKSHENKAIYIPNYVDNTTIKALDKKLVNDDILRVSYIGGIREKQYEYFKIFAEACNIVGNIKFYIHGTGNGEELIRKLEDEYNGTVFVTGRYDGVKDTSNLFAKCELLYVVYDTNNINWKIAEPIKMFEAFATNTPIIVNSNSNISEYIDKYDVGFKIKGNDIEEIKKLLIEIRDNKKILNEKAENVKKISSLFLWKNVAKELNNVYNING